MEMSDIDLLLRGGTVIDGTGTPRYQADVAIRGDQIVAVGALAGATARQVIDVAGLVVAPGFIDVHNHSDGWLLKTPHFASKTLQGFTTEILMSDGISYAPLAPELAPSGSTICARSMVWRSVITLAGKRSATIWRCSTGARCKTS